MGDRTRVYKTEGVILKRRNLGEADTIFTLFSPDQGKFDAIARGVRKSRSRMGGHLEPLTRSRVMLAQGRSLDVFTQAETVEPYRTLREDLDRTAAAVYCAELLDAFTVEHHDQRELYRLFVEVLQTLDAGYSVQVTRYFEVQLLALTGYEIQADACAACGRRLAAEDTLFAPAAGGLVCHQCRSTAGAGRLLGVTAVKVLRFARTATIERFAALRIDEELGRSLEGALGDTIRYVLEKDARSRRFVDEVASLPRLRTGPAAPNVQSETDA